MQYKSKIQLNIELFKNFCGKLNNTQLININGFIDTFNEYADYFGIDTKEEVAHFLSQIAHESGNFVYTKEIASGAAYENRKDLGNIYKGDGVKFKGHGFLQTTGRNNHIQVGIEIAKLPFLSLEEKALFANNAILKNPELLCNPKWATISAFIYWQTRDLNILCQSNNTKVTINRYDGKKWYKYSCSPVEALTRKVNGGMNGYDDRLKKFNKIISII